MESVKLALMKRIEEAMPEVRIDEDYGQLESQEDQYPVVFPCVLIGMGDTEWQPMANRPGIQQGKTSVTLKLAIDCYDARMSAPRRRRRSPSANGWPTGCSGPYRG